MMNCKSIISIKQIVLKDNSDKAARSKIILKNPEKEELILLDLDQCRKNKHKITCEYRINETCPITEHKKSCDFLVVNESGTEHFIELKGTQIRHGYQQIYETIQKLSKNAKKPKFAFIICTKIHPSISSSIQTWKSKLKQNFECNLIIKSTPYEHIL